MEEGAVGKLGEVVEGLALVLPGEELMALVLKE